MGYSLDDCDGMKVSRASALRELRKHGVRSEREIAEFDREVSPDQHGEYDAMAVLSYLGY